MSLFRHRSELVRCRVRTAWTRAVIRDRTATFTQTGGEKAKMRAGQVQAGRVDKHVKPLAVREISVVTPPTRGFTRLSHQLPDRQDRWERAHWDVAFAEGPSAAQEWAAEHGHLLAPTTAVFNGHPVGVRLKNPRTAGRKLAELGAWAQAQRLGRDQLLPAQRWMVENMLHIGPAGPDERPPAPRTQADKWAANTAAARQFHAREGHLHVPRKHVEEADGVPCKLGMFIGNARRRTDRLSPERRVELGQLGMRW